MKTITSAAELEQILTSELGVLAYFSHDKCNVCKVLKPKLIEHFNARFPKIELVYVDVEKLPELAAQYTVFTVPVIIVFFENRETYRKARTIGIQELSELVERPYSLIFS